LNNKKGSYEEQVIFWQLISVYNAVDPENLLTNVNIDEYSAEVREILFRLEDTEVTQGKLREIIKEVHKYYFDALPTEKDLDTLTFNLYIYLNDLK
jgi:hypothetical protein